MAQLLFANNPLLPELPNKRNDFLREHSSLDGTHSPQTSICEEYSTPRPSIHNASSDSDSTSTDMSSTEDSESDVPLRKHVHFDRLSKSTTEISLQLENDEAEFFAFIPSKETINKINNTNKPIKKHDKIRSAFRKTFHRLNSGTSSISSDTSVNEWNETFAKTLVSMHQDIEDIISGFDEIDQPVTDNSLSNTSEAIITTPRLSFNERQRAKIEMMRMGRMLNPPNLLTYEMKESPYPYTDIVEPINFSSLHITKDIPSENLLVQHKPFRHRKFRYRIQRGMLKLRRDLKKIKHDVYGKSAIKSHQELPSLDTQNYRNRLEKTLLEVRTQIAEYDRIHSSTDKHRKSISQVISSLKPFDPIAKACMEDYQTNVRPIEYIDKKQKRELISAPFIPRRARYRPQNMKKDDNDRSIDTRFDPVTFTDLVEEAENFFGSDIPFWDKPPESRLSFSFPSSRRQSNYLTLPYKLGVWARLMKSFKLKQKKLRDAQCETIESHSDDELFNESNDKDDDFYDCVSPSLQQKQLQSVPIPFNEHITLNNEHDSVDF